MLLSRTSLELEVDISDVNVSTLSKAFKLAAKTRLKVSSIHSSLASSMPYSLCSLPGWTRLFI